MTLDLTSSSDYKMEVLDTWNMEALEEAIAASGKFQYFTERPYTALRLTVIR